MAVESATDRAAFVDPDEFGVAATWRVAAGTESTVNGVFDEPDETRFAGIGPGTIVAGPVLVCRSADIPAEAEAGDHSADRLTIGSRTYRPANILDDGTGMTTVVLQDVT